MKMTIEQVRRVAANMLKVMRAQLPDYDAVTARLGDAIDPDVDDRYAGEEYVAVEENQGRLIVSYRRRTGQNPIMVIIRHGLAKVMLSAENGLPGYEVFDQTDEGDYMQDKAVPGEGMEGVLAELEALTTVEEPVGRAPTNPKTPVRETPNSFDILCSVCDERASYFQKGCHPGDDHLIYFNREGDQRWTFSGSDSEEMSVFLVDEEVKALQAYVLEEVSFQPVIDTYCPACEATFCAAHLTDGACPKGHAIGGPA